MILGDVLKILKKEGDAFCDTNTTLYILLLTDTELPDRSYEEEAKKRFSTRGLINKIQAQYCEEASFNKLCERIENRYLSKLNSYQHVYDRLAGLVTDCKLLPENIKQELLRTCDPSNCFQVARFIAACILLGSYNLTYAKRKQKDEHAFYSLGTDFMKLDLSQKAFPMTQKIWEGAQRAFIQSRQEGSRFFDLDIIERLLPHGYLAESNFQLRARTGSGEVRPLMDIYLEDPHQNIAVTGEGGIGKTTFLQQLLEQEFWDENKNKAMYKSGRPIPIFIELKQCPAHIRNWYDEKQKKTNFITRCIGQLIENHQSLDEVSAETLHAVEKELQRIPANGSPEYLLLLDGFNEISVSKKGDTYSCRALLSNEITTIHKEYPNVRIIATSRETQAAYFTSSFQNVYLVGLEKDDIEAHLLQRRLPKTLVGITLENKPLLKCLRIPLFLCMFTYELSQDDQRQLETRGEILYYFFHGNATFYNARKRAADTNTNPLSEDQTALTLDFILPYIGWNLERNDTFSMSEHNLKVCIQEAVDILKDLFAAADAIPFEDFSYDTEHFTFACTSLADDPERIAKIISCAFDYLGILYQYLSPEKDVLTRRQYSFIHHYFRDYFSAMFDIQLLRMLPYISVNTFCKNTSYNRTFTYNHFLNSFYWNQSKKELISQILMEHRNKPVIHPRTKNWHLPEMVTDEQKVLTNAIDFCRKLKDICPSHHLLHNLLTAIVYGRQELSGMDLSNLDFSHCNIFSVPCSKKGHSKTLCATFDHSILPDNFLEPDNHLDDIEEYVYFGQHCYTIDMTGAIKCWDILSGCVEYVLQSGEPNGASDYSPNGYMKISNDGHWLAAKAYHHPNSGLPPTCLYVFDLNNTDRDPMILTTPETHRAINSFSFTEDSHFILYLADQYEVYCFDIENACISYHHRFADFLKHSELYAHDDRSYIYVFSGEYDNFDSIDFYPEDDDFDADEDSEEYEDEAFIGDGAAIGSENDDPDRIFDYDDEWEDSNIPIPCALYRCNPDDGSSTMIYDFGGIPGTYPVSKYFPKQNCFLLFNGRNRQLERFSCDTNTSEIVYEELNIENDRETPSSIQYCPERQNECYVIYPTQSYSITIDENREQILMKYNVSALNGMLNDDEDMEELIFYPNITPSYNRFIIRNSENTYEWDTINDTLIHRYNTQLYECRDFIYDKTHKLAILVHQFNGVSVFGGEPLALSNSFCFPNPEYYAGGCCYHEGTMQLAIMFCKASHEYVEIISLDTGEREIVFSTLLAYDTLESIQFHPSGKYLLITLGSSCMEYDCTTQKLYTVDQAEKNELYIDGCYTEEEKPQIQIAIVEHFEYDEPHIEPHCDFYAIMHTSQDHTYKLDWRYYMPALTRETAVDFLHYSYDIGSGAAYTRQEFQTYWCTNGFFLNDFPSDEAFQNIRCSRFRGKREIKLKRSFDKLQMIFCKHDFALANQYRTEKNCQNYAYRSDDFSEVISISDHSNIHYWKDLHNTPYSEHYVYDNGACTSDDITYAYWDTVIPWDENSLLACYEQYHIMLIKRKGEGLSIEIPYKPCITINSCSFKHVTASAEIIEDLKNCGAKI